MLSFLKTDKTEHKIKIPITLIYYCNKCYNNNFLNFESIRIYTFFFEKWKQKRMKMETKKNEILQQNKKLEKKVKKNCLKNVTIILLGKYSCYFLYLHYTLP